MWITKTVDMKQVCCLRSCVFQAVHFTDANHFRKMGLWSIFEAEVLELPQVNNFHYRHHTFCRAPRAVPQGSLVNHQPSYRVLFGAMIIKLTTCDSCKVGLLSYV